MCRIPKGPIVHFGGNVKESDPIGHLARVEKAGKKAKSSNVKDSEKSRV